ncbi:recombinase [Clostridium putrefaciens]|uniref:Recombinase n=1 Tax=Clostridium putrefaciens TaxID=99675 RepID=A0A381JB71_9CLOT|nr:recombinase [Clostridium putrefaciens]SUY47686.1 recombinase [Clostridium putrefaciens]
MAHIPYGYKIIDGKAVVDEEQAENIRNFYKGYISGLALKVAAKNAGLKLYHSSAGRMLRNRHYLGDDFYPDIIDKEIFDKAEEIRIVRASSLGRIRELEKQEKPEVRVRFTMPKVQLKYTDPFEQAKYAYGLIESEVIENE